jgi:hypothetical protein
MKEISCNIIKDLLPLYVDDVVSDDTKKFVEEHLNHCEVCRKEVAVLKKEIIIPKSQAARIKDALPLKEFKKKWRNKKVIIAALSIIMTVTVVIGLLSFMTCSYRAIPYDSSIISVEEIDGQLYAQYNGDSYGKITAHNPTAVQINGESKKVVAFYYSETLWSKYIEPLYQDNDTRNEKDYRFLLGAADQIDTVFYGEFDLKNISSQLSLTLEKMRIVWGE